MQVITKGYLNRLREVTNMSICAEDEAAVERTTKYFEAMDALIDAFDVVTVKDLSPKAETYHIKSDTSFLTDGIEQIKLEGICPQPGSVASNLKLDVYNSSYVILFDHHNVNPDVRLGYSQLFIWADRGYIIEHHKDIIGMYHNIVDLVCKQYEGGV